MKNIRIGDYVRWEVDVDRIYSQDTKMYVGRVGRVIPRPKEALWIEDPQTRHVKFPSLSADYRSFYVYNINIDELVKSKPDYIRRFW